MARIRHPKIVKAKIKRLLFGQRGNIRIKAGIAKGLVMDIDPDNQSQRILGLAEAEISSQFRKWSLQSDVLIDIGSADGYFGLVYRKLNPSGLAMMFDAASQYKQVQEANFKANGFYDGYESYSKYVSDTTTDKTVSIDDILRSKRMEKSRLLFKIDVDGGELLVLNGIRSTLQNSNCKLIIETHSLELEASCMSYLNDLGYKTTIVDNAWWRAIIPEVRPIGHNRWFLAERAAG
jgi:hypothetical protein